MFETVVGNEVHILFIIYSLFLFVRFKSELVRFDSKLKSLLSHAVPSLKSKSLFLNESYMKFSYSEYKSDDESQLKANPMMRAFDGILDMDHWSF